MEVLSTGASGVARHENAMAMLDEMQIRPFTAIKRRPTMPVKSSTVLEQPAISRKSLLQCFEDARQTFKEKIATPLIKKDPKRSNAIDEFLNGAKLDDLGKLCQDLSQQAEDKANNTASKLLTTLDRFKEAGDVLLQSAPESVSIVWFGISSLITIGNAKVQTRLLICGACDSIANIVADCIRWEAMSALMVNGDENLDTWGSDIPNLLFTILDFLWSARPHFDQSRVKRIGSTLKDLFTKELQERVDALVEEYENLARVMQGQFQESMLQSSFKTGQTLDEIRQNLQSYVSVGADMMNYLQKKALLDELDRQKAKLSNPVSYKDHFSTLNDRLTKIIKDRNGRLVANWLFSEEDYCKWKISDKDFNADGVSLLCLRGPRGHGKSVAMMSVYREITKTASGCQRSEQETSARPPLVCHFFFKKGEQDIERARSALESILYQLLDSDETRSDLTVLAAAVDIINPSFGEDQESAQTGTRDPAKTLGNFQQSLKSLCDTIKMMAAVIPAPVYLMIDALDECLDRKEQCFLEHLRSLIGKNDEKNDISKTDDGFSSKKSDNLKLVVSARDSVDIVGELLDTQKTESSENALPEGIKIIDITSEKNSADLKEYLVHAVGEVLSRRIDRTKYENLYDSQLSRIVNIIFEKANGDFTLARLIIANLQQPSKDTLEKRIKRLPSAIGDIYMSSLESLTADEQEFVVAALKWVVWSVSGLNILEISDHYKEIYKGMAAESQSMENNDTPMELETVSNAEEVENINYRDGVSDGEVEEPTYASPYDDPEVRDTIYHIENAGRDFFKFDRNTGVVNVDISIREWIQQDAQEPKEVVKDSQGFKKFRDDEGNTVFQLKITPSFVRYGDSLFRLFVRKEAHMSIALDILRTLNNEDFQNKYMPWMPDWTRIAESDILMPKKTLRYELEHWHDHIEALQEWWREDSFTDGWWSELLSQIATFTKPETWYRWNLQRSNLEPDDAKSVYRYEKLDGTDAWKAKYFERVFEEPIHLACRLRLRLLVEILIRQSRIDTSLSSSEAKTNLSRIYKLRNLRKLKIQALIRDFRIKRPAAKDRACYPTRKHHLALAKLVLEMGSKEVLELLNTEADPEEISLILQVSKYSAYRSPNHMGLIALIEESLQNTARKRDPVCDSEDIFMRSPLSLAGASPKIVSILLKYGADFTGSSLIYTDMVQPLPSILDEATFYIEKNAIADFIRSAELLVLEGADLKARGREDRTCLHLAAYIRDLKIFKLLCVSGDWDVYAQDIVKRTVLHSLFLRKRPKDPKSIQEALSIYRMIIKLKGEDDLINMEDFAGRNALAYAVEGSFIEGIELLVKSGVDIHDEDRTGANCFHHLSRWCSNSEETINLKIADILLQAGLDYIKSDNFGQTALYCAASRGKWHLARYFLTKYDEVARRLQADGMINPLLTVGNGNLFHAAATGFLEYPHLDSIGVFQELNEVLSKYTDTSNLILQRDNTGRTPLHIAIESRHYKIVEMIIAINPNTSIVDDRLQSPLDLAVDMLADAWRRWESGESFGRENFEDLSKILHFLSSIPDAAPSKFPFAFYLRLLKSSTRVSNTSDDGPSIPPETLKLIDQYEAACQKQHGWSLHDYNGFIKGSTLNDRYSEQFTPSPPSGFENPARIGWTSCPMKLSDDMLNILSIESTPDTYQFVISDHPLPPLDSVFYFEVYFSNKPQRFEQSNVFCEVGFRRADCDTPWIGCDISNGTVDINGSYETKWPYNGKKSSNFQDTECEKLNPFANSQISRIGCGMDMRTQTVFFTVDGNAIYQSCDPTVSVFYPFIGFFNYDGKCRVNFGQENFAFEDANSKGWKWDDSKLAADWVQADKRSPVLTTDLRAAIRGVHYRRLYRY